MASPWNTKSRILRKLPIVDVDQVLTNGFYKFDEPYTLLIRNYYAGMTLSEAAKIKGISTRRASDLVRKFLHRCQLPSNWHQISEQARNILLHD
jgi:hypothetical protein